MKVVPLLVTVNQILLVQCQFSFLKKMVYLLFLAPLGHEACGDFTASTDLSSELRVMHVEINQNGPLNAKRRYMGFWYRRAQE